MSERTPGIETQSGDESSLLSYDFIRRYRAG